jgi:uncharacterized repeat protein (TIGR04076 family)
MLEIEVVEVRGKCPVHKVGDKIVIEGSNIVLNKTDALVYMRFQLYYIMRLH